MGVKKKTDEQLTEADLWSSRISLMMLDQNEAAAIELVKQGILAMKTEREHGPVLDTSLASLLPVRHANSLAEIGVLTIGDMTRANLDAMLIKASNFKEVSLCKVLQTLLIHVAGLCVKLEAKSA